ncbi:hypothetical protein COJ27_04550 [Bacillus cereus]|uniref:Uncharacterized protein n=1 Tax=Bacillus cereus TaxID=1396 RepID=A0A9X6VNR3_BACCE|nr:hypothetical protein CN388_16815 [Bacillus cereus]PFC12301.1 hypothetical protein CN284_12265 [Bacillus cereus]PFD23614.1 hypothetical protein CN263_07485 [Bacillus cereus]PFL69426.1 hypothetical protein COJ27_04550 [Bacillus cereus]PGW59188.1 hypothetical protein COE18_23165 [Bacillus cereus]
MVEVICRALYIVFETICYALCIKDKEEDGKNEKRTLTVFVSVLFIMKQFHQFLYHLDCTYLDLIHQAIY